MFDSLCGVKIKGDMFDNEKSLSFFQEKDKNQYPTRISIVYGKNGSGKSTITKGFQKFSGEEIKSISEVSLYDFDDSPIFASEEVKNQIFVFNEDFIEKNVKLKEDGLETIIMFGEKANLEKKIDESISEKEKKITEINAQEEKCKDLSDPNKLLSPSYQWNKLKSSLQGDQNWAGIDREIRENRSNTPVTDSVITDIATQKITLNETELRKEFEEKKRILDHLTKKGLKIAERAPELEIDFDTKKIWDLLSLRIEKPKLSKRDEMILQLVLEGKQEHFLDVKKTFSQSELDQCPYCLQLVSEEYKKKLVASIETVLNEDVENHKKNLEAVKIQKAEIDFSPYNQLDNNIVEKCLQSLEKVNYCIEQYNLLIDRKIENTYSDIVKKDILLETNYKELQKQLSLLEKYRQEYNKQFDEVDTIKRELIKLNKQIAYYSVNETYEDFLKQKKIKEKEENRLQVFLDEKKVIEKKIEQLRAEQKNIRIAVNYINDKLRYVFFSDKRLAIKAEGDKYILSSNNQPVKPYDISCGERNILALCYFFTLMMNNQNQKEMYTKESLIILDDPVSSFDLENKVGILSYLKSEFLKILSGNKLSRVIIFSHDLATIYDLNKQFEEIKTAVKVKNKEEKNELTTNFTLLELDNFEIKSFSYRKRNEYTILMETIYDFAIDSTEKNEITIGNIMRRVLEAFSTFEYKKGIDAVSCDQKILDSMGNELYSQYFENLMYRLILNGESHLKDRVESLYDFNFFSGISLEEKRRTAKDVLCLIYLLNKNHSEAHLSGKSKAIVDINKWCSAILET